MKYRKIPVVIEAIQLEANRKSFEEVYAFIGNDADLGKAQDGTFLNIKTLEGTMQARIGDFIIKGVNGEFYPCKPDIFAKTYEIVHG